VEVKLVEGWQGGDPGGDLAQRIASEVELLKRLERGQVGQPRSVEAVIAQREHTQGYQVSQILGNGL